MNTQNKEALIAEIERFKAEALKMHIVQVLADTYKNTDLFDYSLDSDGLVIWYKAQARQLWEFWRTKSQAVPESFVLVEKKEFEQMQEFEDLYRRAIFNSKKSIHEVNWSHVSNLGVGSTKAKAMCKRFNIDPEATFRKAQEPANE